MRRATVLLVAGALWAGTGCASSSSMAPSPSGAATTTPASARGAMPAFPAPPAVSLAPASAGADGDYRLAPQDRITVTILGQKDMTRTLRVAESGSVTLPLLGDVQAAGRSSAELEQAIEAGLRDRYLVNPRVSVAVTEFRGRRFGVMGAVNEPGAFALKSNQTTMLQALSEARGVKDGADRVAYVLRARPRPGEPQPVAVDLDALLRAGDPAYNVVVEPGDSVYVPEVNTYYVAGEVERKGAFKLRRATTLATALTEAGGVTKRAATGEVKVIRTLPTGEKRELGAFDLQAAMAGDRRHDIRLEPQDVVVVPQSGAKTAGYAFLDVLKSLLKLSLFAF